MKKAVLVAITLIILIAVFTASMIAYAREHGDDNPLTAYGIHNCDGIPCFRGIKVGMTWDDTHQQLDALNITYKHDGYNQITIPQQWGDVTLLKNQADLEVGSLDVNVENQQSQTTKPLLKLGHIIIAYGSPCAITAQNDYVFLSYEHFGVIAHFDGTLINPDSELMDVYANSTNICANSVNPHRWIGFTDWQRITGS